MKVVTYISPMFLKTQIKNIGRVRNGRGVGEGRGRVGRGRGGGGEGRSSGNGKTGGEDGG